MVTGAHRHTGAIQDLGHIVGMDAIEDLAIGNLSETSLLDIWISEQMKQIRASFGANELNKTCDGCDMYRKPELYRTYEGRERAEINRARYEGHVVKRVKKASGPFSGG